MRRYRLSDIDRLIEIVQKYLPELPNYKGTTVAPDRVRFLLENNIDNATFLCLVLTDEHDQVVGGIGAWCSVLVYSWDTIASDLFLFILPEHRSLRNVLLLTRGYTEWAKQRGAKLITATHTGGFKEEQMKKLLKREGYEPVGLLYHYRRDQ